MILSYEGNNYSLENIQNIEDFTQAIKSLQLNDLLKNGELRWNISFYINNKFYSTSQLSKINFSKISSILAILQLAGG